LSRRKWAWRLLGPRPPSRTITPLGGGRLGLGQLYPGTGKPQQAQEHLRTATTMFLEMDMRFWQEQGTKELEALA